MYLASKQEIKDDREKVNVFISVDKNGYDKVNDLIQDISDMGLSYSIIIHDENNISNELYGEYVLQNIKKANNVIIAINASSMSNQAYLNASMLEAGYSLGLGKKVYIMDDGSVKDVQNIFNGLPINHSQLSDYKNILKDIENKQTLPKVLFNDPSIDKYVKNRIFYISLLVMLDIRYGEIEFIRDRLEQDDFEKVYEILESSIKVGTTVLHFGGYRSTDAPEIWPFKEETRDLLLDYPVRSSLSKIKIFKSFNNESLDKGNSGNNSNENTDIIGTIKMELLIPNHDLLGVSFKPFIEIVENNITSNDIKALLRSDGIDEESIFVKKHENKIRVYYSIRSNDNRLVSDLDENLVSEYGKTCNYVFPK